MSTTMAAAAAVEATATAAMEAAGAAAVESARVTAAESTSVTVIGASGAHAATIATGVSATSSDSARVTTAESASITVVATNVAAPISTIESSAKAAVIADMAVAPTPRAAIPAAEPRAGADENATVEPVRTPVAIRGAGIRVVRVIAVVAEWRAGQIVITRVTDYRTDADANSDLGLCRLRQSKWRSQQSKQQNVAQSAHNQTSCQTAL